MRLNFHLNDYGINRHEKLQNKGNIQMSGNSQIFGKYYHKYLKVSEMLAKKSKI